MQHRPLSIRANALRLAILGASLYMVTPVLSTSSQAVAAANSAQQHDFAIGAGPLGTVLNRFATEAGVVLSFDTALTQGKQSEGIQGRYSVDQGFALLLAGAGLQAVAGSDNTYVLVEAIETGAMQLGATSISGERLDPTTEHSGSYTQTGPSSTANGLNLSLRETPQSVTILTRQRMDDENVRSLQDAANTVTGLTYIQVGSERPTFYSRGFSVNTLQYDGVSSGLIAEGGLDAMETLSVDNMILYDRVEVVRGANGLLQGAGSPSAAINLVRKRPTKDFQFSTQAGVGSWENYSTQIDVSGPLTETGNLRGRAVAYYNDRKNFRDNIGKNNQLLYLISELDITDQTLLTLGGLAQKDNSGGYDWAGQPYQADGRYYNISRSTSLQGDYTYLDKTNYQIFSEITHNFSNDWKLSGKASYAWSNVEFMSGWANRWSGDTFTINYLYQNFDTKSRSFNLSTSGPFDLFGRQHELMLGANYDNADFIDNHQAFADQIHNENVLINIYNPDLSKVSRPTFSNVPDLDFTIKSESKGAFAATRLNITDNTKIILGARASDYNYQINDNGDITKTQETGVVTPYGGIVYTLNNNHSIYASYTDIFSPQNYYGPDGSRLEPLLGSNYEAGLKSEYFEGSLNTSLAIFQIDQENQASALTDLPRTCGPTGTSTCYRAVDKVRNRGFEVEASGAVTPDWQISMGYTYSNPKASDGSDLNTFSPRRLLKISTNYQLPGQLSDWKIGGNIHHQSETNSGVRVQEAYTLLHLRTAYQVNENLNIQYSLRNVFDKKYYIYDTVFGEPRNFMVTVNYSL